MRQLQQYRCSFIAAHAAWKWRAINGIPGIYNSYSAYKVTGRTANCPASKISVSEDGLFESISKKVSGALSDEYVEQIKAQARADAAKGRYMDGHDKKQRTGFSAMRDTQMKQFVSPERGRPISQVSTMLKKSRRTVMGINKKLVKLWKEKRADVVNTLEALRELYIVKEDDVGS